MNARQFVFGLVLASGAAGLTSSAQAQVTPVQPSPMVAARKQVADALAAVNAAKTQVDLAKRKVVATFKTANPDYAKAEDDLKKSQQELDAAKLLAQLGAKKKPDYIAASTAKAKAQEEIRTANQAGGTADPALAGEVSRQASLMSRLEAAALEADPKYQEAKAKNAEAVKAMELFKTQLEQAYLIDPEYTAASQAVAQAQQTYLQSVESMRQTQRADAEARAAASKARSEANKNRTNTPPPR